MVTKWVLALLTVFILQNDCIKAKETEYTTDHQTIYFLGLDKTTIKHTVNISIEDKYKGIQSISFTEPTTDLQDLILNSENKGAEIESINDTIYINFEDLIVGPKTETVEFTYNSNSVFSRVGNTYVLDIPKIDASQEISSFTLKAYFPKEIEHTFSSKHEVMEDDLGRYIFFDEDELKGYGESIIFGEEEYYSLKITNVINKDKSYVVIPPTIIGRQEVLVKSISQNPYKVTTDLDGNTIFHYKPKGPEKVVTEYIVRVYGNKTKPLKVLNYTYTKPIKNWDYTQGFPKYVLSTLEGDNKLEDAFNITKEALVYSSDKANYDYINRIGAENLKESNFDQAVCLEYSDLLISLLRGQKIPAREINGYALHATKGISSQLHSWVEYADKSGSWVQVDPTWSDTSNQDYLNKFDLYHINFLIRGSNSESPVLPGSFKMGVLEEAIEVEVLQELPEKSKLKIKYFSLGPLTIIKNTNNSSVILNNEVVSPDTWDILIWKDIEIGNRLFEYDLTGLELKDILTKNLLYVIPFLLSPFIFWIIHSRLKALRHYKEKVRSIL